MRLAFSQKLFVWGRPGDDSRPILLQRIGRHMILITIEHRENPAARGTVVLNLELGLIEKIYRTTDAVQLTNVMPGLPVQRLRPKDRGDLGHRPPSY